MNKFLLTMLIGLGVSSAVCIDHLAKKLKETQEECTNLKLMVLCYKMIEQLDKESKED